MENINITKKIIDSAKNTAKETVKKAELPISDSTKDFVSRIYNSTTEVIDNFLKTKAQEIRTRDLGSKLYRYENVIMYRAKGRNSYNLEQNLGFLNEFNVAPKFVKYFELGENDFLTVLELSDKKLIPYAEVANKIPEQVKQKFVNDVKELYQKKNIVNKELFANKDALMVTNDGKNIVYADWSQIHFLKPEDKKNMAEFIKDWKI